jgi:hypothetical protein
MNSKLRAWFLTPIVICIGAACGARDTIGISTAVAEWLNAQRGSFQVPTGKIRIRSESDHAYFKRIEAAGLITVREISEDYWSSFLSQTQGMGTPVEVTPTSKLLNIAHLDPLDTSQGASWYSVKVNDYAVSELVKVDDYRGQLSTPGEKYRLVLGLITASPTAAAHVIGSDLVGGFAPHTYRFRAVVKYSDFNKRWSVVALDLGLIDSEQWIQSNVK